MGGTVTEGIHHSHGDVSGGWLRAAVFGAMDGLVTNTALVAGVGGGGVSDRTIVLSGVASLVAGAISMALGEYTSVKTQNEQLDLEVEKERRELERNPEGELAELAEMLRVRGVDERLAHEVAVQLSRDPETALRLHVVAELGLNPEDKPSPWVGGRLVVPDLRAGRAAPAAALPASASRCSGPRCVCGGIGPGRRRGAVVPRSRPRPWWYARRCGSCCSARSAAGVTYAIGSAIGVSVG